MKRYRITLLIPQVTEVTVYNAQAAHNEATKLAKANMLGGLKPIVHSVEHIDDIEGEPVYDEPA